MANTIVTPTVIANEVLMWFKNNLPFASGASHEYDERFSKIGDTYNMREAVKFSAVDGPDITSSIQDVTETTKPLVINTQKTVPFKFSAKELTLSIDRLSERYFKPAGIALANAFDVAGQTAAYQKACNIVGTPGTTPATAAVVLSAGVKLDNASAPVDSDRYIVCNPAMQASMVDALKALNNQSSSIGRQYQTGRMFTALGFDWAMSQNVRRHTLGTWGGTPAVKGGSQTGTTLVVDGTGATGTAKIGDKFTIAGVYQKNAITGDAMDVLQQFTVMSNKTASSGEFTLDIYPVLPSSPADDALLTLVGTANTAYPMNLAYHKQAVVYGMAKLEEPQGVHLAKTVTDPDTGLSVRIVGAYNVLTDEFVYRADCLFGWAVRRPEWISVIIG